MNGEEPVGNKGYCYIFLPTTGEDVLYVGATKDISRRLYQHLVCGGNDYNPDKYNDVGRVIFCEANTIAEAFLIEAVLIDLLRPKWNVMDPCKKKDLPLDYISLLPWHFIDSMKLRNRSGDYARNEIVKEVDHALTGLNKFAADEFFVHQMERFGQVRVVNKSKTGLCAYIGKEPGLIEILEQKAIKLEQDARKIRDAIEVLREVIE